MTPDKLTRHWDKCYGIEPRAHDLRRVCSERWLRIYGLPDGKRYPETPEEYSVILGRHNQALSALVPTGSPMILVTSGGSFSENATPVQDEGLHHPAAWHWTTIPINPDDPQSNLWHLYAREIIWQRRAFDPLLCRVAEWQSVNVIFLSVLECIAYHPYDGGADIIARDARERDVLRERFRDWLSPLPSGLKLLAMNSHP